MWKRLKAEAEHAEGYELGSAEQVELAEEVKREPE